MNKDSGKGEIGLARSDDCFNWKYDQVVLNESFHLSYPFVFKEGDDYYMIPETRAVKEVRLYKATQFPTTWKLEKTLFKGNYSDSSIVAYEGKWWIFTNDRPYSMHIWYADDLHDEWKKHPLSPVYKGDRGRSHPAGRPIVMNDKILRFAQDNREGYGKKVAVFMVDLLDPEHFAEHEITPDPFWGPRSNTWSFNGMHHLASVLTSQGIWMAAVNGNGIPEKESE